MPDVDDYISEIDPKLRSGFEKLRSLVKEALPGVDESIKWGFRTTSSRGSELLR